MGSLAWVSLHYNASLMISKNAVGDRKTKARSCSDILRGEEGIKNTPLQSFRYPWSRIAKANFCDLFSYMAGNRDTPEIDCGERIACIGQQVKKDLFKLNSIAHYHNIFRKIEDDLDLTQAQLLGHQRDGTTHHLKQVDRLAAHRSDATKGAQVRDDFGGFAYLLHGIVQLLQRMLRVRVGYTQANQVDGVADEETNIIQRIVQLVRDARGQLTQGCQFASLYELLLLLAQFLLAALYLFSRFLEVTHDMNHRLAAPLQAQV